MVRLQNFFYTVGVMLLCFRLNQGQHMDDVKRLIQDKQVNYDKSVRPVANQSLPISVYLNFALLSIQEVDEVQQTITLSVLIGMIWKDDQMSWDPKDYGGIEQFTVDSERFWTPSFVLSNTNDKLEKVFNPSIVVRYDSYGHGYYFPGTILKVTCTLDIRYYPLDRHGCYLLFSPWGYLPHEYDLQNITSTVATDYYYPNGAWDFTGSSIETVVLDDYTSMYAVTIFIQRKPMYVIVNVVLPVIILCFLNVMIYFIPTESGERLSFSITLLLAIAVFLTIVGDNLPKSSTPMAYFSFYLLTVLVVSNCITLSVIYSLSLYHRDESVPVGGCWKRIVRVMKCQCTSERPQKKYRHVYSTDNSLYEANRPGIVDVDIRRFHLNPSRKLRNTPMWPPYVAAEDNTVNLSLKPNNDEHEENDQEASITWKHVSVAFDRMCFLFFILVVIVATCFTFGMIYAGHKLNIQLDT